MDNKNLDDNVAMMFIEFIHTFKWPLSIAIVCGISYLGWIDVPVFKAIVDTVVGMLRELPGAPPPGAPPLGTP